MAIPERWVATTLCGLCRVTARRRQQQQLQEEDSYLSKADLQAWQAHLRLPPQLYQVLDQFGEKARFRGHIATTHILKLVGNRVFSRS